MGPWMKEEDVKTSVPAPGWMSDKLRFGKGNLYLLGPKEDVTVPCSAITEVYARILYQPGGKFFNERSHSRYQAVLWKGRMCCVQDVKIMMRVGGRSLKLLNVPCGISAGKAMQDLLPLLRQGNPNIVAGDPEFQREIS